MKMAAITGGKKLSSHQVLKGSKFQEVFQRKAISKSLKTGPKVNLSNFLKNIEKNKIQGEKLVNDILSKKKLGMKKLVKIQFQAGRIYTEQHLASKLLEVSINSLKSVTNMNM